MATNPTLLTMPLAQNGQKNVIPTTQATAGDGLFSQSTGFPAETSLPLGAGGVAPSREDFNGLANLLGGVAFMAQKGWIFQFDAGQEYFAGCIVRDSTNDKLYECINDVAAGGSVPSADSTNWKEFSTGGGVPVGFIMPYAGTGLQEGYLGCDGSAVSRTMYPDLFAAIGTTWGAGDGSTTFNLPRSEDLVMQGASATNPVGTYLSAGLPNIKGVPSCTNNDVYVSGAFYSDIVDNTYVGIYHSRSLSSSSYPSTLFDASRSSAIYGASDTVQPPAACVKFMIKAFDGPTPSSAGIDLTQYAADLANKADRSLSNLTATGEDHFLAQDFTIIYPNGGSEANPANVTYNTRYVLSNPFTGYKVKAIAELKVNGDWGEADNSMYASASSVGGIKASAFNDDTIILQTGRNYLLGSSDCDMNPFNTSVVINSAPCRVKVWKIGKVASE